MPLLDVLADRLGNRMEHEAELHFSARSTGQSRVVPDLMVLPPECELPAGMERNRDGRTVRLDEGHPLPELVAEIVSPTSEVRDLEDKLALYAALGIAEYLACHPGDLPNPEAGEPGSPAELRFFRLQPDGTYRQAMDAAVCFSHVCGTQVRLWQPDVRRMARFQWWDEARGRWRDPVADAEHARELQETRTASLEEGEAKMAVAALHSLLPALPTRKRGQVAAHGYRHGPSADAMDRILTVRETPVGPDDNDR